ncbi:hypothetical protein [Corynebacterium pseudodiphtheriticum]|uniref:Secreted protein n=1 Tax=Corynebacterium pseudodiphtheriticum TaxID=37637 RepID=A0AAP4BRI8_9CORY|nr:hypothetical protein [Corynebacterium pseudodiphtheriticum]MDK4229348.1 hypothetical protein [Corynebacterium pseudodiphtheriticum]MDK4296718.1 hypothetical protein [Corynebacterium pseudodiphtheriticum]MDK4305314.1 hypothetical protein [Corynebacterium pseudodiphtheriticum]MDK4306953.1 hypothetical protein [Corynebacterium pseudodiphtheriticum]RUP94214.1 hypothetical protein D8M19_03965 [Corynebacterium pseudodiphtheriticum]
MKTRGTAITAGIIGTIAIAGGGIALATSGQEPFSENAFEVTGQNENLDVTVDGIVQPGEELLIAATCPGQDVRADLDTSFGESTTMSPGADVGKLIGYVTVPADFTDEDATATITCSSGVTDTVAIN